MLKEKYLTIRNISQKPGEWLARLDGYCKKERAKGMEHELDKSALMVIDMQNYFLDENSHALVPSAKEIIPNIKRIISFFREKGLPVIFTRFALDKDDSSLITKWWEDKLIEGGEEAEISKEFNTENSIVLRKTRYSAFKDTKLSSILNQRGVRSLVITGLMTHLCCDSTARDAFMEGCNVYFVIDATASYNEELHLSALRCLSHGFVTPITTSETIEKLQERLQSKKNPPAQSYPPTKEEGLKSGCLNSKAALREQAAPGGFRVLKEYKAVIIGGGPAGIASAIQLKRQGIEPLLIEKEKLGGCLLNASLIENYPGFPDGISGVELAGLMIEQLNKNKIKAIFSEVKSIEKAENGYFKLVLESKQSGQFSESILYSKYLITATGTIPKRLGLENEDTIYKNKRLFYEIREISFNDSPSKNRNFAVIGSGDAAFDYALNLSRRGNKIKILCRNKPKALEILKHRVNTDDNIEVMEDTNVVNLRCTPKDNQDDGLDYQKKRGNNQGDDKEDNRGKVVITCKTALGCKELKVDYVLAAVGRESNIRLVEAIKEDKNLFIVGDANKGRYRQLAISTGDALEAVMNIYKVNL